MRRGAQGVRRTVARRRRLLAYIAILGPGMITANAGNTRYTWNRTTGEMLINGVGQGAPGANRVFLTIWDGNGIDTYDMANYTNAVTINLNPGSFSITSRPGRVMASPVPHRAVFQARDR